MVTTVGEATLMDKEQDLPVVGYVISNPAACVGYYLPHLVRRRGVHCLPPVFTSALQTNVQPWDCLFEPPVFGTGEIRLGLCAFSPERTLRLSEEGRWLNDRDH
ncbi:hypothetical protein SKAU_G00134620 [Synaphobranchus kaupii]|uniref:Uncharacterized protein n=1 Tax=Synaphobranchus kaupii TaxID=118154 RepID=A0A9Q1FR26_SYNKA|nr:hypothetical protein SKAU_G00134620 [Synaphobranchus kaupii]